MVRAGTNSLLLGPEDRPTGGDPLDDLAAQHQRPAEFARSLLEDGITAMRIWPVDAYAIASGGRNIESADLQRGVQIVEAIGKGAGTGSIS